MKKIKNEKKKDGEFFILMVKIAEILYIYKVVI